MSDSLRPTEFGFAWGPLEVTRLFSDKRGVTVGVKTARTNGQYMQVFVTPTGKIRVHLDGEWKPVTMKPKRRKR